MTSEELESRIVARGKELFVDVRGETPSLFNKGRWTGKLMDWCMKNERFKVQLFRFVDVFPSLTTGEALTRHLEEYFGGDNQDVPAVLKWGARGAGLAGALGARMLNAAIRHNIEELARQFIIGENTREAVPNLAALRTQGFAFTVDVLGEATVSEEEAERYLALYLELLSELDARQGGWAALEDGQGPGRPDRQDWGWAPKLNVSVKSTALYSQTKPADFEGSVQNILGRMKRIYARVAESGGFLCIDMETRHHKEIVLEVFRRLRSDAQFRDYPHLGIALQAYLHDTGQDLRALLDWAEQTGLPISVRLVKGAYWDYETVVARQNGWDCPVYAHKPETDAAFERLARTILEHHELCHLGCGSHNIRTIAAVLETARALNVPEERYEFQVLYGMAEPVRQALRKAAKRVRLYCPYGELVPGMAYLVRRLLENTANESFLRQGFAEHAEIERLLENPLTALERERGQVRPTALSDERRNERAVPFENEPAVDFAREAPRRAFREALASARRQLGKTYALFVGGEEVATGDVVPSVNPANPAEVIGRVCQAGVAEADAAIAAARKAFPAWRDTPPRARADYLRKAADAARRRLFELAAWQVLEVGKQWDQAHADVAEAIDYLEYYAREMIRLGAPLRLGGVPGEVNRYFYEPKGVAAVIAPWNFPLAISCGMASAAIVAGNCVVFKPSGLAPVIGHGLAEIFREAGLPAGVFNCVPGRGGVIGDFLVEHPAVSLIAFTGSREVGLRILEKAAQVREGQENIKKAVVEMGGKNAILIDDDADLDEAVPGVLQSAFGFQGQKCSACSRVIVLDAVYERFVARLVSAARSMKLGPAEDPGNALGPVVDGAAQKNILQYVELTRREGQLLYCSETPPGGYYVPLALVGGIRPEHRIAQEEIFGPVLAVMRVKDFGQALEWANATRFALTGGVFSRSPRNLERARREFRVGNLYLNRAITGALVGRQPFGGARMSGVGSKAGGPDYLLQFMDPRTVTENTMRRGFAPAGEDEGSEDWGTPVHEALLHPETDENGPQL